MDLVRSALVEAMRFHPRVRQQELAQTLAIRERLAAMLPKVVPFRERTIHQAVAILDWDHRLPSKQLTLRLHLLYDVAGQTRFEKAMAERSDEIKRKDLYPEFDVPDFGDLPGDESYDADLTSELAVDAMRLVSPWRREVDSELAHEAVRTVRGSASFQRAKTATPTRPPHLGDLEAVAWMPPCESGQPRWTIDVWWLTAFDGRVGKGWSFLVELEPVVGDPEKRIVAQREFTVRTA